MVKGVGDDGEHNLYLFIVLLLIILLTGSYAYSLVEGWNYLDSTYFVVMTATTIGYGDFVPKTDLGKIFTIFYSFVGVASVLYFISAINEIIVKRNVEKKLDKMHEHLMKSKILRKK